MMNRTARPDLFKKDGKLNLVLIAGGEINLNACIAGPLRRDIVNKQMDINGLAVLVCAKEGDINSERVRDTVKVIDAIQGQRLREISAEELKIVYDAIGLKREDYLCLPLVENWREELIKEMKGQGYKDFSDEALKEYMTNRILEDLCKK